MLQGLQTALLTAQANFLAQWWLYLSMPLIAAVIGYVTKIAAVRMMFQPLEFIGIKPWLGWQGVIPRKAEKMASIAVDVITKRLITVEEIFHRLDPKEIANQIEKPMLNAVEQITREVLSQHQPGLWELLPNFARERLIRRVQAEAPQVVAQVMADLRSNIGQVFDLKHMVIGALLRDKRLLNRVFAEVGRKEFKFFGRSGLVFGFIIGLVQMIVWLFYQSPWILPAFGLFIGFASDWLALQMLFHPKQPKKILGLTYQGLFLKRQQEVSSDYARLVADQVITPANIWQAILQGPGSDKLFALVQKQVEQTVDEQAGIARPLVAFAIGSRQYQQMKKTVTEKLVQTLPTTLRHVDHYAEGAMDIRNTLMERMQKLSPEEFEGMLRPAFKEDEWSLIVVGAVLGFIVGELQTFMMLH
ncbi:DUF445 domain-containing protein [Phenylobacterium sp.]|uniref:DUF445 domain-containing protein n=1 Tax=Phenylobacterium sp. TaxID=1871053 RepID=UPI002737EF95|nr:DUF445 family protein [Phenylobacterium sp.]MDP3870861.1 DUF445 family protein [Phenylobacterium sp.]